MRKPITWAFCVKFLFFLILGVTVLLGARWYSKQPQEVMTRSFYTITEWHGGDTLPKDDFRFTIREVIKDLTFIEEKDKERMTNLLLYTCAAETDFGQRIKGPAQASGLFQILPSVFKDMKSRWFVHNPKIHAEVFSYYDKKHNEIWNLRHNVRFQIALAASYYLMRTHEELPERIKTPIDCARLYKAEFNTSQGKGSIERFLDKVYEFVL